MEEHCICQQIDMGLEIARNDTGNADYMKYLESVGKYGAVWGSVGRCGEGIGMGDMGWCGMVWRRCGM